MDILELSSQQGTLFVMILAGAVLAKKGIIDGAGQRCLTDLCVNIIIIGIIGITLEKIIKFLERKLTGWQEKREI